jgi:putative photosynthetic complex assembly protein
MTFRETPAFRNRDKEMVPKGLLYGMAALALSALAIASYASLTGAPHAGVPDAGAAVLRERSLILQGHDAQAVTVRAADGALLADLPHGGFVTVIQSGLATQRKRHGVDLALPVRLVEYANNRLVLEDPETGWSAELYAFGNDNKAAFERLFDQ